MPRFALLDEGRRQARYLTKAFTKTRISVPLIARLDAIGVECAAGDAGSSTQRCMVMRIVDAQREMRTRYVGGFYGQLVSGLLWLLSAGLAVWSGPRAGIMTLVLGGFFIFAATEILLRIEGARTALSTNNSLRSLGMQVAFVLPLSMPLLLPVSMYRLTWFYPGLMILLGAHYLPFAFLYGMRMFLVLAYLLVGAGVLIAMYWSDSFSVGAWLTGAILLAFAVVGRILAQREYHADATQQRHAPDRE